MARDVDFNVTANDRTGNALGAAARNVERTQRKIQEDAKKSHDRMKADAEKSLGGLGKSLISMAAKVSPQLATTLTEALGNAGKMGGPAIAAGLAAAAPLIGATISAAVVGGAGIGGVLGGVMLAARDPRVAAAGKALGAELLGDLSQQANPFVKETLNAIERVRVGYRQVSAEIGRIFDNSAKFVGPLTNGLIAFTQGVVRGFDQVVANAGPIIDVISKGLARLGGDVQGFLTTVAGDGTGAAAAMQGLIDTLSGVIQILGPVIAGLTDLYNLSNRLGGGIFQLYAKITEILDPIGAFQFATATTAVAAAITATVPPAQSYAETLAEINKAQRENVESSLSLYAAQTSAAQAFRDAKEAVGKHGSGLSLNTKAGLENRTALESLAGSLNAQYNAYVKVHGATAEANEVLRANRERFIEVARQAGISAAAAGRLADKLIGVPSIKPKIELLDNASGKVNNVINRLAAVKSKTVTLNIAVRQSGDASALRKQSRTDFSAAQYAAGPAAAGGSYRTGGPTPVNVASTVEVNLDGRPFAQQTTRIVDERERRQEWRARVGRR